MENVFTKKKFRALFVKGVQELILSVLQVLSKKLHCGIIVNYSKHKTTREVEQSDKGSPEATQHARLPIPRAVPGAARARVRSLAGPDSRASLEELHVEEKQVERTFYTPGRRRSPHQQPKLVLSSLPSR